MKWLLCLGKKLCGIYQCLNRWKLALGITVNNQGFSLNSREYRSRFTNEETVSFCLRVMVGVIILYDHVHPVGAFAKTSKIDVSFAPG